MRKPTEAG
jgi:hypothetical protein